MSYIDGFLVAVPTANREAFREHVVAAAQVCRDYGALRVVECWGDDVPRGKLTDMYMAVKAEPDETVVLLVDRMAVARPRATMAWPS